MTERNFFNTARRSNGNLNNPFKTTLPKALFGEYGRWGKYDFWNEARLTAEINGEPVSLFWENRDDYSDLMGEEEDYGPAFTFNGRDIYNAPAFFIDREKRAWFMEEWMGYDLGRDLHEWDFESEYEEELLFNKDGKPYYYDLSGKAIKREHIVSFYSEGPGATPLNELFTTLDDPRVWSLIDNFLAFQYLTIAADLHGPEKGAEDDYETILREINLIFREFTYAFWNLYTGGDCGILSSIFLQPDIGHRGLIKAGKTLMEDKWIDKILYSAPAYEKADYRGITDLLMNIYDYFYCDLTDPDGINTDADGLYKELNKELDELFKDEGTGSLDETFQPTDLNGAPKAFYRKPDLTGADDIYGLIISTGLLAGLEKAFIGDPPAGFFNDILITLTEQYRDFSDKDASPDEEALMDLKEQISAAAYILGQIRSGKNARKELFNPLRKEIEALVEDLDENTYSENPARRLNRLGALQNLIWDAYNGTLIRATEALTTDDLQPAYFTALTTAVLEKLEVGKNALKETKPTTREIFQGLFVE